MARRRALTGPPSASAWGLDGFRDHVWPDLWCAPISSDSAPRLVRTRGWMPPVMIDDVLLCPVELVLRHLNAVPDDLVGLPDHIAPIDRVELALEHALRDGAEIEVPRASRAPGDVMLRAALARRDDEPPTESYAETRAVQLLRRWDLVPWRQIPVYSAGKLAFRADFMIPFAGRRTRRTPRPDAADARDGVLVEVDSREFHADQFDHDTRRGSTYDALGLHWISITPHQIEHQQTTVQRAIAGAFRRAGHVL